MDVCMLMFLLKFLTHLLLYVVLIWKFIWAGLACVPVLLHREPEEEWPCNFPSMAFRRLSRHACSVFLQLPLLSCCILCSTEKGFVTSKVWRSDFGQLAASFSGAVALYNCPVEGVVMGKQLSRCFGIFEIDLSQRIVTHVGARECCCYLK